MCGNAHGEAERVRTRSKCTSCRFRAQAATQITHGSCKDGSCRCAPTWKISRPTAHFLGRGYGYFWCDRITARFISAIRDELVVATHGASLCRKQCSPRSWQCRHLRREGGDDQGARLASSTLMDSQGKGPYQRSHARDAALVGTAARLRWTGA